MSFGKDKYILGISFGFHDSAVCLVQNGKVISAVEEERFSGIKHDSTFPKQSIKWILKSNRLHNTDISTVCYYENPNTKRKRILDVARKTFFKNPIGNLKLLWKHRNPNNDIDDLFKL